MSAHYSASWPFFKPSPSECLDLPSRDVSFVYPTRPSAPVLQGLSLVLRHGKATALVGRCVSTLLTHLQERRFPSPPHWYLKGPSWTSAGSTQHAFLCQQSLLFTSFLHTEAGQTLSSAPSFLSPPLRSGVGKTTVASLLLRLYPVSGGGIFLGGHPISAFTRAQWVAGITAVSQDPVLFSGGRFGCLCN